MTSICLLSDSKNNIKKSIVSELMFASVALLDPELSVVLPWHVTATTGTDAFVHALESYTGIRCFFSQTRLSGDKSLLLALTFHSDKGSQYCSRELQKLIKDCVIRSSMSTGKRRLREGDYWDNAVAESFFGKLKLELVFWGKYINRDQA